MIFQNTFFSQSDYSIIYGKHDHKNQLFERLDSNEKNNRLVIVETCMIFEGDKKYLIVALQNHNHSRFTSYCIRFAAVQRNARGECSMNILLTCFYNYVFPSSCVGRVQPFISQLLHATLDQAEQQVPPLSARVGRTEIWQLAGFIVFRLRINFFSFFIIMYNYVFVVCN